MKLLKAGENRRVAAYQRELIETHYAEVENMYRQMRVWRHDYRSHLQTLKAHAAAGNLEAIKAYLDELDTELAALEPVIKTGNPHGRRHSEQQAFPGPRQGNPRSRGRPYSPGPDHAGH